MSCTDEMFYVEIMTERRAGERLKMTLWSQDFCSKLGTDFFVLLHLSERRLQNRSCYAFKFHCRYKNRSESSLPPSSLPPATAHKMHILRIKRKFVSYLLCSMGIFIFLCLSSLLLLLSANIIKKENLFRPGA